MSAENLTTQFLPLNARMRKQQSPHRPSPATKPQGSARDAEQARQRDRDLGTYGHQLIDRIYKDYDSQVEEWKKQFGKVVTAFATAIGSRDRTLEEAKLERQTDAAFDALILGLLVGGAMHFLNAYLQYTVLPKFSREQLHSIGHDWLGRMIIVPNPPIEFSKVQKATFGGIAEELGNKLIPLAFPAPTPPSRPLDTWDGVMRLQDDFNDLISKSKQLVLNQFTQVQGWMTDSTEFGAEWALYTGGDVDRARQHIYRHIDSLRYQWAREWEFFGWTPNPINRDMLANNYERSFWAGYLLVVLKDVEKLVAANKAGGRYTGDYLVRKAIENAIIKKLKHLNVVKAETHADMYEQAKREGEGSPGAVVDIEGSVDRYREALRLRAWAETYLKSVRAKTEREFFPPARERTLPRL